MLKQLAFGNINLDPHVIPDCAVLVPDRLHLEGDPVFCASLRVVEDFNAECFTLLQLVMHELHGFHVRVGSLQHGPWFFPAHFFEGVSGQLCKTFIHPFNMSIGIRQGHRMSCVGGNERKLAGFGLLGVPSA